MDTAFVCSKALIRKETDDRKCALCRILSRSSGAILIITHGPTIDASVRQLLKLGKTVPRWEELDAIGVKYPYCSTVMLEQVGGKMSD